MFSKLVDTSLALMKVFLSPKWVSRSVRWGLSMRRLWCCSAGTQACDLVTCESKFLQNFIVMLADPRRPPGRHLGNTVHLNRTADGRGQLLAGSFERNDDVIRSQLRIINDFLRLTHGAEGDVNAVEDLIPMRHRL